MHRLVLPGTGIHGRGLRRGAETIVDVCEDHPGVCTAQVRQVRSLVFSWRLPFVRHQRVSLMRPRTTALSGCGGSGVDPAEQVAAHQAGSGALHHLCFHWRCFCWLSSAALLSPDSRSAPHQARAIRVASGSGLQRAPRPAP